METPRVERSQLLVSARHDLARMERRPEFSVEDRNPAGVRRSIGKGLPDLAVDVVGFGDEALAGVRSKMADQSGSLLEFRSLQPSGIDDCHR